MVFKKVLSTLVSTALIATFGFQSAGVAGSPTYLGAVSQGKLDQLFNNVRKTGYLPLAVKLIFTPSPDGTEPFCLVEVLHPTSGSGPSQPHNPNSPEYAAGDLPAPFKDLPNQNNWLSKFHETYPGASFSSLVDGHEVTGDAWAVWGYKTDDCLPNPKDGRGNIESRRGVLSALDGHGSYPVERPVIGSHYQVGDGWNMRQFYIWYHPSNPSKLHLAGDGAFIVRRWVYWKENTRQCTEEAHAVGFDRAWAYYMNVAKYTPNGTKVGERLIEFLGCGGPPAEDRAGR